MFKAKFKNIKPDDSNFSVIRKEFCSKVMVLPSFLKGTLLAKELFHIMKNRLFGEVLMLILSKK